MTALGGQHEIFEAQDAEEDERHQEARRREVEEEDGPIGTYVVQFSGGVGSWASARRLVDAGKQVELLVACTNSEADDWWPFVEACQADLDVPMTVLDNGGRTIWDVFREQRFLGNTRVDICSRILKRDPLRRWLETNRDPAVVIGFDWTEQHRIDRAVGHWHPWRIVAPLAEPPYVEKWALLAELEAHGISIPELYLQSFSHNNCGGGCVKAGQAQWERLLRIRPATYAAAETEEEKLRVELGDVAILRDRSHGDSRPLPLRVFRERLESQPALFDGDDWGACSCMTPADDNEVAVAL